MALRTTNKLQQGDATSLTQPNAIVFGCLVYSCARLSLELSGLLLQPLSGGIMDAHDHTKSVFLITRAG